jgi:hypothetical protein
MKRANGWTRRRRRSAFASASFCRSRNSPPFTELGDLLHEPVIVSYNEPAECSLFRSNPLLQAKF